MRSAYLFCFAFAIMLLYNSCDVCSCKKIPCPGFENTNFSSWFPYNQEQTTIFKPSSGDADTINFSSIVKSQPYEASKGCYHGASGCDISASIYATTNLPNNNISISFWEQTPFESSNLVKRIDIRFGSFVVQATDITSEGLQNILPLNYTATFYPTLNINNTAFANVQLFKKDTTFAKEQGIYKLFLSRDHGIVGYEKYPSLITWIKH